MSVKLTLKPYIVVIFYLVRCLTAGLKCYECTIVQKQASESRQQSSDFCVQPQSSTRVKNCNSGDMCGEQYWDFNFTQDSNTYQYGGLKRNCFARINNVKSPGCKVFDKADAEKFVAQYLPEPTTGGTGTTIDPNSTTPAPTTKSQRTSGDTRGAPKLVEAFVKQCQCGTDLCNKETYFHSVVMNNSFGQQVRPLSWRGLLCVFMLVIK